MTQREQIYEYIERFGSITPMQAFSDLGVTKLATRVSEMRADGIVIDGEYVTAKNRLGKTVRFMKYTLPQER